MKKALYIIVLLSAFFGQENLSAAVESSPVSDTVAFQNERKRFLPTARRIERIADDICFVYRGETAIGFSVSYATLTSDDTNFMLLMDNFNAKGTAFTLNPSIGYFIKDNLCVGARFGYTRMDGHLGNISINPGSGGDINLSLSDIGFESRMSTLGTYLRSYAGVDPNGHFGLFAELELMLKTGISRFYYKPGEEIKDKYNNVLSAGIGFSTGVSVYIFPNVSTNLSFGLGGFDFTRIVQKDAEGNITGSRTASKMNWKLNLLDIKIGVNIHL